MQIQEIPIAQWPVFFDQFSRIHRGQPADVHTLSADLGDQPNAQNLPLQFAKVDSDSRLDFRTHKLAGN